VTLPLTTASTRVAEEKRRYLEAVCIPAVAAEDVDTTVTLHCRRLALTVQRRRQSSPRVAADVVHLGRHHVATITGVRVAGSDEQMVAMRDHHVIATTLLATARTDSGVTSHRQPRRGEAGAQNGKGGTQSDPNYVSRLLLDCVPVFHKIITPAYLLYRSGPVAIYYSEIYSLQSTVDLNWH